MRAWTPAGRVAPRKRWHFAWDRHTVQYLAYQVAAYVVMNLGDDVALAALLFVN